MAIAGKSGYVTMSASAISTSSAAMVSADGKVFQISASSAQGEPFHPTGTITVYTSSAGTVTASCYAVHRLNGSIVMNTTSSAAFTITTNYLPTTIVGSAYSYEASLTGENVDVTTFTTAPTAYRSRIQALKDFSGSLNEYTSTGKPTDFANLLVSSSQPVALSYYISTQASFDMRAWALLNSNSLSAGVDGVLQGTVGFEGSADNEGRVVTFTTRGTSG